MGLIVSTFAMFHHPLVIVKSGGSAVAYEDLLAKYSNRQVCEGAVDALQVLETKPADVVIAELDVGDMSGVDVAEAIRDIDAENGHYTFVVLVGDALTDEVREVFGDAVDAFVATADIENLPAVTRGGARVAERINQLVKENTSLIARAAELERGQLLDPLTGLGNKRMAQQALVDAIRQIESRGGAVCFLLISVANYEEVLAAYDETIAGELIIAVAERIHGLVRPMDVVTYFDTAQFALVLVQPSITQCTAECYERIFDGVRLKS
ncbi:MAG: diguanylate cyclase, partial [Pseudomonadales bacterium]|nr:diguanylate cyclase [Pseudomonadales bacterium]